MITEKRNLISAGASIASRHKRYVLWFYLLSVLLACCGAAPFSAQVHDVLDHSVYADRLLHGFDLPVLAELLAKPESGTMFAFVRPSAYAAILFILLSILFMPGVLTGYAANIRIPREEFFRACGTNLWRFVRLTLFFLLVAVPTTIILGGIRTVLVKAAENTSNERLPFFTRLGATLVTLLVLIAIRAWFDLAQTDVIVRNESRVRKSVAYGFRTLRKNFGRLWGTYVAISIVALLILFVGVLLWSVVPPASVIGAVIVSQLILFLLLATRFWQRASAVGFYLENVPEPVAEPTPVPVLPTPTANSILPEGASG